MQTETLRGGITDESAVAVSSSMSTLGSLVRRLLKQPASQAAFLILVFMVLMALTANFVAPYSYKMQARGDEYKPPATAHWLGTDSLGRDILSRVMYGSQISMLIGICATLLALFIGINIGLFSGYFGGKLDAVLMRMTDTVAAFPSILLAVAITAIAEKPRIWIVFVALGLAGWTSIARVVRSQVLTIKTLDYITAARALGISDLGIIFRHVLPNCLPPIIVVGTLAVGGNILGEAGLSFLGLGVQEPFPSWGGMLNDARNSFRDHWWLAVFPGLAIVLTVLAFNLLGDGLRDALDPRNAKREA